MQLFLMRHSIAEPTVTSDFDRNLTPEGVQRAQDLAEHLLKIGITPSVLLHSPLTRSRQTAEIVAKIRPGIPLIELSEVIDADDSLMQIIAASGWQAPLVIGHNPTISVLASALAGPQGPLAFSPASFAAFEINAMPPSHCTLSHWVAIPPRIETP